jgi:2-polyprenyl-6-methoxyphenol hydroxylase-like FAD-dependent oxidoreductase
MKIIIIGAGIGGLTTAIALQQKGFEVQVYEAAPEIKEAGAGLWVAANAINILEKLGLSEAVKAAGNQLTGAGLGNHYGQALSKVDFSKIIKNYGNGTVAIHRGHLQRILLENTLKSTVFTNRKLKNIIDTEGVIQLEFEDGTHAECDILIGADGIRSVVRKHIFGDIPLRYSGQTCWRGIVKMKLEDTKNSLELWGTRGGLRTCYSQVNEKEVYWYVTLKEKANRRFSTDVLKPYLLDLVSEFQSRIKDVIAQTDDAAILHNDLYDFKPIPKWYEGNIVLVGDAAHASTPNLGQGACQAIEDAYVLAECLVKSKNSQDAFQNYEDIRLKKAQFVVNTSYQIGLLNNIGGAVGYRVRNFLLKITPQSVAEKQFDYLFKLNYG